MAKAQAGWYADPMISSNVRWWDGRIWGIESHPRASIDKLHTDKGYNIPDYDIDPNNIVPEMLDTRSQPIAAEPQPEISVGWSMVEGTKLTRWYDGSQWTEYFAVSSLFAAVTPEFIANGGGADPLGELERKEMSRGDFDLLQLLLSRMTPARLKSLGASPVSGYSDGPAWIVDEENPHLSRWWDGERLTGDKELSSIVRQLELGATVEG